MSAIGSYAVIGRREWPRCVASARSVHSETKDSWVFKKTEVVGLDAFRQLWQTAVLKSVDYDYSGYVLGTYLDVQEAINGTRLVDQQSEVASALGRVFTAAFPFEASVSLPDLPPEKLLTYGREEYGGDGPAMVEAVNAAHVFYQRGLAEISSENLVVFVIA